MVDFLPKEKCAGCTACVSICPKSCLEMAADSDGFLYPCVATDACVHCGLCEKVCPVLHKPEFARTEPIAGAMRSLDETVWKDSSSGGAFYELSRLFFEAYPDNGIIFAARFEKLRLVHRAFGSLAEIAPFQKSKYLQSDLRGVFSQIKQQLSAGRRVLFVGTPCQVAGLRSYLREDQPNLLCVDFVCHGVGSPGFFQSFIRSLEKKFDKQIVQYEFRTKKGIFGNYERYCSKLVFDDDTVQYASPDDYNAVFLKQLCTRKLCGGDCPFRDAARQGDITIADFNGKSIVFPALCDEKNYSAIVFQTEKGKRFLDQLKASTKYFDCELQDITRFNPLYERNAPGNPERDAFMERYAAGTPFDQLIRLAGLAKPPVKDRLLRFIPWKLKFRLRQGVRKIRK